MSYVWCGIDGWCYCFNVVDVFTRQWPAFVPEARATRHEAVMAVNNAVAAAGPALPGLTLRVDNGYESMCYGDSRLIWGEEYGKPGMT